MGSRELRVFTGSAHPALGEAIARFLGIPLGRAYLARFADGEVWFQIQDNVRGADVFMVQHIQAPDVAERIVERGREIYGREPEFVSEVGPVIGAHVGPGLIGVTGLPSSLLGPV